MQEIIVKQHQKQYYKQSQKKRYAFAATTVVQVFMFAAVVILLHAYINYLVRCLQRSLAKVSIVIKKQPVTRLPYYIYHISLLHKLCLFFFFFSD